MHSLWFTRLFLLSVLITSSAIAEQISVADCAGLDRARSSVDQGELRTVAVTFADVVNNAQAVLKSSTTDLTITGKQISPEIIEFQGVAAGDWKFCQQAASDTVAQIEILDSGLTTVAMTSGGIGAAGIGAVALLVGGTTVAVNSGSDRDGSAALVNDASGDVPEIAAPIEAADPQDFDDSDYDLGAKADPLSPFS